MSTKTIPSTGSKAVSHSICGKSSQVDPKHDEWNLIQACKCGDNGAWDVLIGKYEKLVYKFAFSLARNYDDASDIAGQVFLRLYENLSSFKHDAHFTSWLFCIVRNVYIDTCVRAPHRSDVSLDNTAHGDANVLRREITDPSPSPEERSLEREKSEVLRNAILHLPHYQRNMVLMYHSEGKSYEEIANATGLSLGTVKSRLSRARQMLRTRLDSLQEILAPT